jgi:hypothetical protein
MHLVATVPPLAAHLMSKMVPQLRETTLADGD